MLPRLLAPVAVAPASWDEVTPQWFERALARDCPGAAVSQVTLVGTDDGTNRRARFALEYARGSGPAAVFVKAHSRAHRWVHLRNGNLFGEARLFASGIELPIEHPRVFHAVPDYLRLDFLLVMEDLTARGGDPRDATRPLSVDQVASGLRGLARLHSAHWNRIDPRLRWVRPWAPTKGWQVGLRKCVPTGIERGRDILPASLGGLGGERIVDHWVRFVATLRGGAQTLLHGDAHIGNTYVLPDGTLGFLDWQVVRRGHWSQDVGYFLIGALTEDDARRHEADLLGTYLDALDVPDRPGFAEAWQRYSISHAYGLAIWLSTLGTTGYQPHEVSRTFVARYAAACERAGTFSLLDHSA